jgi:hypothetical protein
MPFRHAALPSRWLAGCPNGMHGLHLNNRSCLGYMAWGGAERIVRFLQKRRMALALKEIVTYPHNTEN